MRAIMKFHQTVAAMLLAVGALVPSGCFVAEPSHTLAHDEPGYHEVKCIRFSGDSTKVAAARYGYMKPLDGRLVEAKSGAATVWEVDTGKLVVNVDFYRCKSVAFHPTKSWLAASGIRPNLQTIDYSALLPKRTNQWDLDRYSDFCAFATSSTIVAENLGLVILLDSGNGKILRRLEDSAGDQPVTAYGIDISHDGRHILASCSDDRIRNWQLDNGKVVEKSEPVKTSSGVIAISPDDRTFGVVVNDGTSVRVCDTATMKMIRQLGPAGSRVRSIAFSPDGKTLAAACCAHPTIVMIDAVLNPGGVVFFDVATGAVTGRLPAAQYSAIAYSPDGKHLATGTRFGEVRLWKLK